MSPRASEGGFARPPKGGLTALAVAVGAVAIALTNASPRSAAWAQAPVPRTDGWVLLTSRCVICHGIEIALQQRQGPQGWGEIVDRMVGYGMPLTGQERQMLIAYLVRHFGDPDGR
jgi:hypothetical protein